MELTHTLIFLTAINGYVCDVWNPKIKTIEWTFALVQKEINQSIVSVVSKFPSITRCMTYCSRELAEYGVSLYYDPNIGQCNCNTEADRGPDGTGTGWIYYGQLTKLYKLEIEPDSMNIRVTVWPYRSECKDLLDDGYLSDGIYSIVPWNASREYTFCDMSNGGWTVIQRRFDGSVDFYLDWQAYRLGFGNRNGEYWLGLENIHRLSKNVSELIIKMEAFPGQTPSSMWAHYTHFSVDSLETNFKLHISGFNGSCGDAMVLVNGFGFTTYDNDNDAFDVNCAVHYKGAGWHRNCHYAHFNGQYFKMGEMILPDDWATGIHWNQCWGYSESLRSTLLMIRKKSN